MAMKGVWLVIVMVAALVLVACGAEPTVAPTADTFESPVEIANPASKYCVEQGYEVEIRTGADGQVGYCIFDDGTECEEWAYFRGECAPGTPKP
ncbi:MAG: DUF333 domain-containing protein [Anaerolineae bacterium]|nr:DUF333 domain-containing protein [Anaerolineae bacterium]